MLKAFRNILVLLSAAVFGLSSCAGNQDEDLEISLEVSSDVLPADGVSQVKFTVYEGNANVTADAVIKDAKTEAVLIGNTFSTSLPGEYVFYAEYNGVKTNQVKVTAEVVVVSKFVKNVCLMEFTDASCTFCPDASNYIDRNILGKMDYVHLMAFHEKDDWASDQFYKLMSDFSLTTTPAVVVDMMVGVPMESGGREEAKLAISTSLKDNTAYCGVAVSSVIEASGKAKATVKLFSEKTVDYRLALYVVEDGIRGYQKHGDIEYNDYYHQYVVRKMASGTVKGDDLGKVNAQTEATKEYIIDVDHTWNLENTYVYALALDADGRVNNMQLCLLNSGETPYEYVNN